MTGAAFAVVGALIAATPTIGANHDLALASAPGLASVSSAFQLLSKSEWEGSGSEWHGNGSGNGFHGNGSGTGSHSDAEDEGEDEGDDDHHHGGGGSFAGLGAMITSYLDANQAQVLSFSAMVPQFSVFGVTVGDSSLANAYYTGIDDGTGTLVTGVDGVLAYVASQRGVSPANLLGSVVLSVTSMTPKINLGPLTVGHGLLAGAYINGYDSGSGNVKGFPGIISYVTDELGLQSAPVAPAAAVKAAASTSSVVAARKSAAVAEPAGSADETAAADNSTPGVAKADSPRADRPVSGRAVAKAARAARAVAE
jgi:hypothetical protein